MDLLVPLGGFLFVLGSLGAANRIHRGDGWFGHGMVAALGFACMVWMWAVMTAS